MQNLTASGYRLPLEAEWEFAALGSNQTNGVTYSGSNTIGDVAWYTENSGAPATESVSPAVRETSKRAEWA